MTEAAVDDLTADLDLLDDDQAHVLCTICYPNHPLGMPYIARCGRKAIPMGPYTRVRPPNVCPGCLALANMPCPRCGR